MNRSIYDTELQNVKGLTWIPWIGENYAGLASDKKILLIGESHYYDDINGESSHDRMPLFTREIIDRVINRRTTADQNWRFFENAIKLLLSGQSLSEEQEQTFWSNIAFYNFVQRSVKNNNKEDRPKKEDFLKGWLTFFELIKVIKPSVCIFLGTTSAKFLRGTAKSPKIDFLGNLEVTPIIKEGAKRRYKAINCSFLNADNENIELIFVKHPSQYFSTDLWRKYLEKKILPQLEWLNDSVIK